MTLLASLGFTATFSSPWRREVQSWLSLGFVVLPRLAQPRAVAVASGGRSELPAVPPAISARSSLNVTSAPPEGWEIALPLGRAACPLPGSIIGFGPASAGETRKAIAAQSAEA